jgi:hypothetical protein
VDRGWLAEIDHCSVGTLLGCLTFDCWGDTRLALNSFHGRGKGARLMVAQRRTEEDRISKRV